VNYLGLTTTKDPLVNLGNGSVFLLPKTNLLGVDQEYYLMIHSPIHVYIIDFKSNWTRINELCSLIFFKKIIISGKKTDVFYWVLIKLQFD
jgi:hypothetical protein